MNNPAPPPEVGQAVRVRNRLGTVRAVEPYDTRTAQGRLNIVEVEYLDDFRYQHWSHYSKIRLERFASPPLKLWAKWGLRRHPPFPP